jgi:beta-glucanase (GH16 family)
MFWLKSRDELLLLARVKIKDCTNAIWLVLLLTPAFSQAQSAYDPSTTETFSQATAGMSTVNSYNFGTAVGNNVTNLQQLAASFNPYGIVGTTVINEEWERYQAFNPANFVFQPSSLNLTATIPANGGLYPGGIYSGQIWSKQTYQPGVSGQQVYAMSVRMKFPNGAGMWPAVWLYSPTASDGSEVDITEFEIMLYQNQTDWTGVDHGPGSGAVIYSLLTNPWVWEPGLDFSADFHNYQMIWTPDATYKYFDDKLVYAQFYKWTSGQQAQLGVNLAVGSNVPNLPGLTPTSLAEFPSALQLQSITILGNSPATAPASPSASAVYGGLDSATGGAWTGKYGGDGYMIANGASSLPAYATVSVTGDSTYTWATQTSDGRALQSYAGSPSGIASCYNSSGSFNINVNVTDGSTRRVALYLLDWDGYARSENITILDASTNAVLDKETISGFHNGAYAMWNIKGNVVIQVAPAVFGTAVVSGVFFGSASAPVTTTTSAAVYSGVDTGTQGLWTGKYGADGFSIANDSVSLPSYATLSVTGDATYTWATQTSDARALQSYAGSPTRIASTFDSSSNFNINVNLTDGNSHRVALYLLDWDGYARAENITILDAGTNAVLDKETFSGFHNGEYAVWNIKGNVVIQVAPAVFGTAVVSGVFFN